MEIRNAFYPKNVKAWRVWLAKNHLKEKSVSLIRYKKHTGKPSLTHLEAMHEAICFGWIDTTVNRIDDEKYAINFVRRTDKSRWSNNTLSYAKKMIEEGRMSPEGIKRYKEGLAKPVIDHGLGKNPPIPKDLEAALNKNKKAKENFHKLAPSYRRVYIIWVERAKLPETRKRRIKQVVQRAKENKKWGV